VPAHDHRSISALDPKDDQARAEVEDLLASTERSTGHPPLAEASLLAWSAGGPDVGGLLDRTDGVVIGYAHLSRRGRSWTVEIVRRPGAPQDPRRALLAEALAVAERDGAADVRYWDVQHHGDDSLAADLGFTVERDLLQMRVPLPLSVERRPVPPDFVVRSLRPGDEQAWLEVNNRAFAAHPEQGHWELEDLLARERTAWFDPQGFLLCEHDGTLAASCWTKVHGGRTPPLGEIYVISVNPDFQGRGLGRFMTVAGLDWLATTVSLGMLYVDASNTTAVVLYRGLGFRVDHVDRCYLRRLGR